MRGGAVNIKGSASEVTVIPALLGLLELRGCIVTLDAMGCQREIAEQIREQGADYVLAVKANQAENFAVIRHIALNLLKREPLPWEVPQLEKQRIVGHVILRSSSLNRISRQL